MGDGEVRENGGRWWGKEIEVVSKLESRNVFVNVW